MPYLLDTNIVFEGRKQHCDPAVRRWLDATPLGEQFISVLTIGEIGRGIARLRRRHDDPQAEVYRAWLASVVSSFGTRIVPVSIDVAAVWGEVDPGLLPPTVDALIGATAKARGWTLATRNTKDFEHMGILLFNPFTDEEAP